MTSQKRPPRAAVSLSRIFLYIKPRMPGTRSAIRTAGREISGSIIFLYIFSRIRGTVMMRLGRMSANALSSIFGVGIFPRMLIWAPTAIGVSRLKAQLYA